jgi:hypothetical protein
MISISQDVLAHSYTLAGFWLAAMISTTIIGLIIRMLDNYVFTIQNHFNVVAISVGIACLFEYLPDNSRLMIGGGILLAAATLRLVVKAMLFMASELIHIDTDYDESLFYAPLAIITMAIATGLLLLRGIPELNEIAHAADWQITHALLTRLAMMALRAGVLLLIPIMITRTIVEIIQARFRLTLASSIGAIKIGWKHWVTST